MSIFLGSLALLGILALWQRVWIRVIWGSAGKIVNVSYLTVHFRMPQEPKKKQKRKQNKKQKESRVDGIGWLDLAPELLQAVSRGATFLLRHSELRYLRLEGTIGLKDVAATGMLWGIIQAADEILRLCRTNFELAVTPTFEMEETSLTFGMEGTVRLVVFLTTTIVILWHLPRQKLWRFLREQGPKQKHVSLEARLRR